MRGQRIIRKISPLGKFDILKELAGLEPRWNSRRTQGRIRQRMESVNRETKVREELAWVYVQFLFLASFSAPLVDGASGLRVRGHVCDSQNWFYFPIPEDRIYSSWHNHPLTHGRPQNTGHTNRSEMLLKLV